MKKFAKILAGCLLAAISAVPAQAQLLWRVSGNGAKDASYIFGTHHIAPASMIDSIAGFKEALNSVDVIYGELDMLGVSPQEQQAIAMRYALAPADSTLTRVLTPEQTDTVNSMLGRYSNGMVTVQALDQLKPAFVATQLGVLINLKIFPGFNPAEQLDTRVQQLGTEFNKPSRGFETYEQQFEMLMGDPISEQVESLMKSVREEEKQIVLAERLADSYLKGDLKALEELFIDDEAIDKETRERLVNERNDNWIKQMCEFMPNESAFIAVGCGHLVGEHGLIQLLRNAGYTVEPETAK